MLTTVIFLGLLSLLLTILSAWHTNAILKQQEDIEYLTHMVNLLCKEHTALSQIVDHLNGVDGKCASGSEVDQSIT